MGKVWTPANADQAADAVRAAIAAGQKVELIGAASRRGLGRPVVADVVMDLSAIDGVISYQPEELVLTVGPGARMADLEVLLASGRQHLAFEPPDYGPLWGLPAGQGTIGGAILTGRGGPRRLTAGGPRDHCLGIKGVNGFGEAFGAGGRVVKNVTGFDLPKLIAGSFGTLCAITELSLKVLPAPEDCATLALLGLDDAAAVAAMSRALGSPAQVSSAAHLPSTVARHSGVAPIAQASVSATLLRLEGVGPSVAARMAHLQAALADVAPSSVLGAAESHVLWKDIADARLFTQDLGTVVWKLSVAPTVGGRLGPLLSAQLGGRCFYDWGGGAVWLELPTAPDAHAAAVRRCLQDVAGDDGHATLMRAPAAIREAIDPFQPLPPAVRALTRRVREQFNPDDRLNPGRMYREP
jgi:glycolate oxidase FAD binding subunit